MRMYHFDTSALIHARRRTYPIQNFQPKLIPLLLGKPGAVHLSAMILHDDFAATPLDRTSLPDGALNI